MIPRLASPSVCVIDDEEQDYRPILDSLLRLGLGCVHVEGKNSENLPPQPFKGLRLVFTDLHLSGGSVGKSTASHTANVFSKVVSVSTAPVVVVIWSKYKDDPVTTNDYLPPDDQPTEADLFKQTLLDEFPEFNERLIFVEDIVKPKPADRPEAEEWVKSLQVDIKKTLEKFDAFDFLWSWESLVREAGFGVSECLTSLALLPALDKENGANQESRLHDNLKMVFRLLARAQGESDCSAETAPRHLASVLGQSLLDHLEHSEKIDLLSPHGCWLSDQISIPKEGSVVAPKINEFLLTSAVMNTAPFLPGTVYQLEDKAFEELFGVKVGQLSHECYSDSKDGKGITCKEWRKTIKPVLIEISPECDVAQRNRRSALLIAGLIVPAKASPNSKNGDAFQTLPTFSLRGQADDSEEENVFLIFCSRYKTTMPPTEVPSWLTPWFRLRELPTASLRNWHSGHSSRVGYVSMKAAT